MQMTKRISSKPSTRRPRKWTDSKPCSQCKQAKPLNEFPLRRAAHGVTAHSWCLECYRAYHRAAHYNRKEANNRRSSKWQLDNPEKALAATKKWKAANGDKISAYNKAKYDEAADGHRARAASWRKANPNRTATNNRNRRALRKAAGGSHTQDDIRRLRTMQRDRCAYCLKALRGKFHVDHITPLSLGGSNAPRNLQLTCSRCNLSKSGRHPIEYARLTGRLI